MENSLKNTEIQEIYKSPHFLLKSLMILHLPENVSVYTVKGLLVVHKT